MSETLAITCDTRRFYKPVTVIAIMECTSFRSKESGLTSIFSALCWLNSRDMRYVVGLPGGGAMLSGEAQT